MVDLVLLLICSKMQWTFTMLVILTRRSGPNSMLHIENVIKATALILQTL